MQEMKQRYDTVNEKLWNLETRMDTMSRDQAENSCAIQSKLDALLRNITAQDCNGHKGRGVQDHHEGWSLKHYECTRGLKYEH